ncbi:hypothetical protein Pmani_001918 [Petrolisthes manimaculis]|uniref:Uncharacterized protein n=1 Tax=Petrolisthes manimaculis TaxID=1843537 RepID=A0AAE1QJG9_9EUCA|nr:hypothetical protein Pmani_001918 [Petrolisthes manimaculis]
MERHNKALASIIPSKNANTTEGLLPSNEDTTSSKESGTPAEQTNQLSDFTLPLMDKVQILLKYINFEELKQMKPDIRKKVEDGEVFGIQENQNDYTYSRLSLDNGRLFLHCFQNQPPPLGAITLPVSEIIKTLNPESTITFLEMAWEGVTRGRVYIRKLSINSGYFQKLRVLPETQGTSRNSGYFQKLRVLPETQGTSRNSGYFQKLRVLPETQGTSRNSGYFQKLRVLPETQGTSRNERNFY